MPSNGDAKPGYQIKTVSELTGIPKNTLVAWERRYGILNPERQPNGYRLYSDRDIAVLTQIKSALADGLRISEAVGLVNREAPVTPLLAPAEPDADAFQVLRSELQKALLRFDRTRADQLVQRLTGVAHAVAIEHVHFPLLRAVGDAWERGDVSVAQEHFASAFVREQLTAMLMGLGCGPEHGTHVACTTFPDDRHEIGVLGLSVLLAVNGCRVTYLGANTPLRDIGRFAAEHHPAWLCISVIMPTDLRDVLAYARELRATAPATTRIAIGGSGLPQLDNTPVNGVDFLRDFRALELLSR